MRECKDFIQRLLEIVGDLRETLIAKLNNLTCLVPRGLGVSLLENGMKHSRKCGPLAFGHLEREILSKMRTTALPANCRQYLTNRSLDSQVSIASNEIDLAKSAGLQILKEPGPLLHGLRCSNLHPQQFTVAVIVDTGSDKHTGSNKTSAFANFHRQRVTRQIEIRAAI